MTQDQVSMLTRIYNTLLGVHTCGEDSFMMTDCLRALQQIIVDANKTTEEAEEE
jgi:hypothetical protein